MPTKVVGTQWGDEREKIIDILAFKADVVDVPKAETMPTILWKATGKYTSST